jgi:hypothetical protein
MTILTDFKGQNVEATMLIASLRDVIRKQAEEIESLQQQLKHSTASAPSEQEVSAVRTKDTT